MTGNIIIPVSLMPGSRSLSGSREKLLAFTATEKTSGRGRGTQNVRRVKEKRERKQEIAKEKNEGGRLRDEVLQTEKRKR